MVCGWYGGTLKESEKAKTFYDWDVLVRERIGDDNLRYRQRCLFEPLFPENLPDLYEPWMRHADRLLLREELPPGWACLAPLTIPPGLTRV